MQGLQRATREALPYSPYLQRLCERRAETLAVLAASGPKALLDAILARLGPDAATRFPDQPALMRHLREVKADAALVIGLADLADYWDGRQCTAALSSVAAGCTALAADWLLRQARQRGQLWGEVAESGWFVLGMGKLGGGELNYSSDIDLIVFFERGRFPVAEGTDAQRLAVRLTQDLGHILQERTADGYVFRVDLRLRPDPASTPLALSTSGAMTYYESVGQNWERAAMIKARPIAGDTAAAARFLKELRPFIWRKSLDYVAIDDILSIKRQIDARHTPVLVGQSAAAALSGFNLKLGPGGIREIEFFAQIQQLLWGGRLPELRSRATTDTLAALAAAGRISSAAAEEMTAAYWQLRRLEHRLQMQDDWQTHSLPDTAPALDAYARFAGYNGTDALADDLIPLLERVRGHFRALYADRPALSWQENGTAPGGMHAEARHGNLVFTGVEDDPDTLATLHAMGFREPARVAACLRGWHHGNARATRTKRARELLTELAPELLRALAATAYPDQALLTFDQFVRKLPAGVQLFALFRAQPALLGLVAAIMGSAPGLAMALARRPALFDAVLHPDFYAPLRAAHALEADATAALADAADTGEALDILRRFVAEKRFQTGVLLIQGLADLASCERYLSDLADVVLCAVIRRVRADFEADYGAIPGSAFAALALGKLGSREMTFSSDLDIMFVYDVPATPHATDAAGAALAPSTYYARLAQRVIGALTSLGADGRLYAVDTRLRPLGKDGPIACSFTACAEYYRTSAWTFERMALTRARPLAASASADDQAAEDKALAEGLHGMLNDILSQPHPVARLTEDTADMRRRVATEHPGASIWDVKHTPGGLVDIEFLTQHLVLRAAAEHPQATVRCVGTAATLRALADQGVLPPHDADVLMRAHRLQSLLLALLRVCSDGEAGDPTVPPPPPRGLDSIPPALQTLLATTARQPSPAALAELLQETQADVQRIFRQWLGIPGTLPI